VGLDALRSGATCNAWLEQRIGCRKALLTHSCTAALEMTAILAGIGWGDEVIMPSCAFVSTANAFVLRGSVKGRKSAFLTGHFPKFFIDASVDTAQARDRRRLPGYTEHL